MYPRYLDFGGSNPGLKHPGVSQGFGKFVFDLQNAPSQEYPVYTHGVDTDPVDMA
jgi:hypothetical protein